MARRRRMTARQARFFSPKRSRRRSSGGFSRRRVSRRSNGGMGGLMGMLIPAAIYGAARAPVARLISPLTSKLPFGAYNDEAGMAGASFLAMKYGPSYVKKVGMVGMIVEAASTTSQVTAGFTSSVGGSASSNLFDGGGY